MSAADTTLYTQHDIRRWLVDAGFVPIADDWWRVAEPALGHLESDEVLEIKVFSDPPG